MAKHIASTYLYKASN